MTTRLEIQNLSVAFPREGALRPVVDQVSFSLSSGECLALVGESGSGKSVTALATLRLLSPQARVMTGSVALNGEDLLDLPEYRMDAVRGRRIGMVFQDPMSALNPVMTIGDQLLEALRNLNPAEGRREALDLLDQVGLPDPHRQFSAYPHQLSGGMRQRVLIAQALAGNPDILIADEPTTALDVLLQAQIMRLLDRLRRERGMALWLITHDLAAVQDVADRILVMRHGRIVEGAGPEFFEGPQTPYGRELLEAIPKLSACLPPKAPRNAPKDAELLLRVRALSVGYPREKRLFSRESALTPIVKGVDLELASGETLALVGGSGCGKTTLARGLLGLATLGSGAVEWCGQRLSIRGGRLEHPSGIQVVFQDPFAAMNPRMIVSSLLEEGLMARHPELSLGERRERISESLVAVGLDDQVLDRYPHEFSGGQRQRLCIARSLVLRPKLLILDEPTSALDVTVQAQVLSLLEKLRDQLGLSYLFITHDLGVVARTADRMAVMHQGEIVEMGKTRDILTNPRQAVTRELLEAMPRLRRDL